MFKITKIENLDENFYILNVKGKKKLNILPGNFFMVRTNNLSYFPLLNRPFSVLNYENDKISFLIKEVGIGTKLLKTKKMGEEIKLEGPFGNSFNGFLEKSKKIYLFGGGTGIAPLFFLSIFLEKEKYDYSLIYGAKSKKQLVLKEEILKRNLNALFFTEDGSFGEKGLITDYLKNIGESSIIFSCGPNKMMEKIERSLSKNNKHFVSLENIMACGFGVCLGCVVPTQKKGFEKYQRVCKDGPIFDASIINWKEFMGDN